jgi:hypothetical protein
MNTVVGDTRAGVSAIAPSTDTAAGKQVLVGHLQGELDRAKALLVRSEQRNILLANMIRSAGAGYGGAPGGGVMAPMASGAMPSLSGGAGSPAGLSGLGISSLAGLLSPSSQIRPGTDASRAVDSDGRAHAAAAQAVKSALSKLGRPYVWGEKGPKAFDCSGLVRWAYAQAGITLGADTYSQINQGAPVAPGHVVAGDVIFPKSSFGQGGRAGPGHVMLALNDRECIEAQQSGVPVKISPMPRDYVARRPTA